YLATITAPSSFSFSVPPPTKISTLSLHDALPIYVERVAGAREPGAVVDQQVARAGHGQESDDGRQQRLDHVEAVARLREEEAHRSEEHTSELQSRSDLVCRLLLEKKKQTYEDALA